MKLPPLGQGTSHSTNENALRLGIGLGMKLIDTAENYQTEELVGRALGARRDGITVVSKIWPSNVDKMYEACKASLRRLGTKCLDLYLLHWPDGINDFAPVVQGFEDLRTEGMIREWGVSNFSVEKMEALFAVPGGDRCFANQIHYNLTQRQDAVISWCHGHGVAVMAYSPLGGPGASLLQHPALQRVANNHFCTPAAVALAWTIRNGICAIPKADNIAHVAQNVRALDIMLSEDELAELDAL